MRSTTRAGSKATFAIPGHFHEHPTDENYRRFFERYRQLMEAQDWDELRALEPAGVAAR